MDEQSQLMDAIREKDLTQIERLLNDHPELVNTRDSRGNTPLSQACLGERLAIARYLLQHGADVSMRYWNDVTILHRAVIHLDAVWLLIEYGADINARDDEQQTPLHWAARNYNLESIRLLLEAGANLHARDHNGSTVIDVAFEVGPGGHHLMNESYSYSYEQGSFNILDEYFLPELSPIFQAVFRRTPEDVERMLDEGANPNEERPNGKTPLFWAIRLNRMAIVRLLLAHGGDPNYTDTRNITPLHYAASMGGGDIVLLLLEYGGDPTIRSHGGGTALGSMASAGNRDGDSIPVLKALIRAGADPCPGSDDGWTPLHAGAFRGHEKIVAFLITLGCDLNAVWEITGETPLHKAVQRDQFHIVPLLLDAGADINSRDGEGDTPLHIAINMSLSSEYVGLCQLLLDHGADLDLRNNNRQSPRDLLSEALQDGRVNDLELKAFFQRYV